MIFALIAALCIPHIFICRWLSIMLFSIGIRTIAFPLMVYSQKLAAGMVVSHQLFEKHLSALVHG